MPITIRFASAEDAALLCALIHAAFEEYRALLLPPSGAHAETTQSIAAKLTQGGAFIAERGDETAGCVIYAVHEDYVYLGRLAVLPAHRHHGLGARLVAEVETAARAAGKSGVQLGVRAQLPRNLAFFQALGYHLLREERHAGYAQPTIYILRKEL